MALEGLGGQPDLKVVLADLNDDVADVVSLAARNALAVALVDSTGAQLSSLAGGQLVTVAFDTVTYTNTSSTVDTYTYKTGGTGGTTVATVTVTWTDATKSVLVSVVRT